MTPTLATRSDLAPRARQLLEQQLAECGALLGPLLQAALDELEEELFRIAERSSGGQVQHEALEALRAAKRARPAVEGRLLASLAARFAALGATAPSQGSAGRHARGGELSLVDPNEFDEAMALDDLAMRTELHASSALFELCQRYAALIAAPALAGDALPCGPHAFAALLGDAAHALGIQASHRKLLYRLCDRRLLAAAEPFYGHLNQHLEGSGILPHLRGHLPHRALPAREPDKPSPAAAPPADAPLPPLARFSPPANVSATAPSSTGARTLHTLLAARRQTLESDADRGADPSGPVASLADLEAALVILQARPVPPAAPHAGERLRSEVVSQLRRTSPTGTPPQLQPAHRDAMDLMSLLFDRLLDETRTEGTARQLLAALQVPLLRIALADGEFFTVRSHPARRLLNEVIETANLWLDHSDGSFDTSLRQRLQGAVRRIATGYHGDLGVIRREADDLEAHLKLLAQRAGVAERHRIEAAQGRDRLHTARAQAQAAIEERLAHAPASPLVRALLEHAWTDALTLTLLREGAHSEAWWRRLAVVDELLGPAAARDDAHLAADLQHGLTQVGLQASEAEQLACHALDLPASATSGPEASQTELLIRLKSRRPPAVAPAAPAGSPKLALTPTERDALSTLQALPFGSWLEFTINQQGWKVVRKLAWFNPVSGRCLLLNARGGAAPESTLDQIARRLARGQASILPPRQGGTFDRAWNALLAGLRTFSRNRDTTETAP